MSGARDLSYRIGETTVVIEGLENARASRESVYVRVSVGPGYHSHKIPEEFCDDVLGAVIAVLMHHRALDAVALARATGVPAPAADAGDATMVLQLQRALPPESDAEG